MSKTGNFIISCDYLSNDIYNGANCSFNLYVPVLNVTNSNIRETRYGNTVYFSGNLVDTSDEEEVIEGYLKFFKQGSFLGEFALDENGNFVFMWTIPNELFGKNISISADYYDDLGNYNPCKNIINKSFFFNKNLDTEVFLILKRMVMVPILLMVLLLMKLVTL
ncbi:MAG: hypothetical protein MJ209_04835 [archaeon]|nr:hypothetical protein [archaeon]